MSPENGAAIMNEPIKEPAKEVLAVAKPAPAAPRMFTFVPTNLEEAMTYAKMISDSDFVPKDYRGKSGNCLVGMQFGAELGLPPLQALQNIAVINGKPGIYGDLGKALLYSKGFKIEERDVKEVEAKTEAWCRITRPNGQVTERTFSKANAMTAGLWGANTWKAYPYRMMAWRAFWWAARDAAADVLKGIWGVEELIDFRTAAVETTAVENAPKEVGAGETAAPPAEPTPENPVVDAVPAAPPKDGLSVDQRKELVALMTKFKVSPEQVRAKLRAWLGITDEKRPTAFVPQSKFQELKDWIENPQDELEF